MFRYVLPLQFLYLKVRIVCFVLSFLSQPNAVTRYEERSKQPPIVSGDGSFELCFEHNWDLTVSAFLRERLRGRAY